MARGGLYWFTDPGVIGQKFSAYNREIDDIAEDIVDSALDKAVEFMERAVNTRGVSWGQPTGGPRRQSDEMFNSIDKKMHRNQRGRVQGEFGFINGAPYWTKFQEYGTDRTGWGQGIKAMHAFSDAQTELVNEIQDQFSYRNIWENF